MAGKDEKEALGAAMQKAIGAAAREVAGEKLTGNAKILNELIEEVVGQQQRLKLRIYRKGFGLNSGTEEFITALYNVDPETLRDGGVEPMIQQYCGGGTYRIVISAPGVQAKTITVAIAGEPLSPKADGKMAVPGLPLLPGQAQPMIGPAGQGYNLGGFNQQPQSHLSEAVMLAQFLAASRQKDATADTDEVKALREQLIELKAQATRAESEKARIESERRADAQIAALQTQMEKLATPKEDPSAKVIALVGAVGPIMLGYLQSREQATQAAAQAQAAAQQHQTNMMIAMMGTQKDASKESLDLFKTMLLTPKESETDRMRGIMDIAASSMSTTMGLSQAMINQVASMQPGERPWWQDMLMNLVESAAALGQQALESRSKKVDEADDEPAVRQIGPVQVQPALPRGVEDVAAAAAAAQQNLATPDEVMPQGDESLAGVEEEQPIELPDFSAGAFKLIFEKISAEDGDTHEVAFRVWKHASSGNKDALDWVANPIEYTLVVLDTAAQQGKLLVTAERIHQVADAMLELFEHFRSGGNAAEYVQKHGLSISLPKRLVVVPLPPREPGEIDYEDDGEVVEGEGGEEPQATNVSPLKAVEPVERVAEVVPEPEPPKEPATPTPSFGSSPPKVQ